MDDQNYHSSQDRILYQIKRLGPQSAKSLAQLLGMTTMGARQHLVQLEAEGLVAPGNPVAQQRGRPVIFWQLTDTGHRRFPDAHAQVTTEIIASVRDVLGEAALDRIIEARGNETVQRYLEALDGVRDLEGRLKGLARLRTDEGYMAEFHRIDDGAWLLVENHCPICIAAQHCQGFCRSELACFRTVFDGVADVTREEYLIEGARRCTYRVTACK